MTRLAVPDSANDGDDLVLTTPWQVIKSGTATVKVSSAAGFQRGNNKGVRLVADGLDEQANIVLDEVDGSHGSVQAYLSFEKFPDAAGTTTVSSNQEFLASRAGGNAFRLVINDAGVVTVQNRLGSNVATLATFALNTPYRCRLKHIPGSTTSNGYGLAEIWNDSGTLITNMVPITNGDFGGSVSTVVTSGRIGDPSITVASGFRMLMSLFEVQTGSTMPEIGPVAKNATNAPPTVSSDKTSYEADETVTLTVSADTSTITVTGVTPAPSPTGSGTTRTFVAPRVTNATTLTITVSDPEGASASITVTIQAARARILYGGQWRAYYSRVQIANPDIPLGTQRARWRADILTGSEGSAQSALPSWNGVMPEAVQSTLANRPILRRDSINGHHALEFDGNRWFNLQGAALDLARNKSNLLIFVVYKLPTTEPTGVRTLFSLSIGGGTGGRTTLYDSNGTTPRAAGRRLDTDAFSAVSGGTRILGEAAVLTASFRWETSDLLLFKNGAQVAATTTFQTDGSTSDTSSQVGFIGVNGVNPAETFVGQIAEVLVYEDADTSGALRQQIHSYVQDTYAIPVADYSTQTDVGE